MKSEGHALDATGEHWITSCPACRKEFEYKGFFDFGDKTECSCGQVFTTSKVWINDYEYIT